MHRYEYRIKKEYYQIKKFNNSSELINLNNSNFLINLYIDDNFIEIYLNIDDTFSLYPFKKPNVYINGNEYSNFLSRLNHKDYYLINKNSKCIYCDSILCNWSAGKRLINLVKEITDIFIIKNRLELRTMARRIKIKYNLPKHFFDYL